MKLGFEGRGSTCARGAARSGRFDSHVIPPQTGPQEPQHQAHTRQRFNCLQTVPTTQRGVWSLLREASSNCRIQQILVWHETSSSDLFGTTENTHTVTSVHDNGKDSWRRTLNMGREHLKITSQSCVLLVDAYFPTCNHRWENIPGHKVSILTHLWPPDESWLLGHFGQNWPSSGTSATLICKHHKHYILKYSCCMNDQLENKTALRDKAEQTWYPCQMETLPVFPS